MRKMISGRFTALTGKTVFCATMLFALGACESHNGPWPMPTGYTYHQGQYKTPPGPEAEPVFKVWDSKETAHQPVGTAVDTTMMETAPVPGAIAATPALSASHDMRALDMAASDLVKRMIAQTGQPMESVYIEPGQNMAFEASLRNALQEHGVKLAPMQGTGPFTLRYIIGNAVSYGQQNISISLMASGGMPVGAADGMYALSGSGASTPTGQQSHTRPMSIIGPAGSGF